VKRSRALTRLTGWIGASVHTRGFVLWVAALITGIVCVWQHVCSTELASDIETLKSRRDAIEARIGFLEMDCLELSSRERIERHATEQLGMRYPDSGEVIWLGPSGRIAPRRSPEEYVEGTADAAIDS